MIGAIVLARREVLISDVGTGKSVDQTLIENSKIPLLNDESTQWLDQTS